MAEHLPPPLSSSSNCVPHYKRVNTLNEKQAHIEWKLPPQHRLLDNWWEATKDAAKQKLKLLHIIMFYF